MKVLIVSDSHGLTMELEKLVERQEREVNYFIHCGDSELEADHPSLDKYIPVRGNCDYDEQIPEEVQRKLGDQTIYVTHGHRYSVKTSLMKLSYRAERSICKYCLFWPCSSS